MKNIDIYTIKKIEKIDYEEPIVLLNSVLYYCYRITVTDIFGNTKTFDFDSLTKIDKWLEEETYAYRFIELLKMLKRNGDAFLIVKHDGTLKIYDYDIVNEETGLLLLDSCYLNDSVTDDLKDGDTIIKMGYDGIEVVSNMYACSKYCPNCEAEMDSKTMIIQEIIDFCEMKSQLEPENDDIFNCILSLINKYKERNGE